MTENPHQDSTPGTPSYQQAPHHHPETPTPQNPGDIQNSAAPAASSTYTSVGAAAQSQLQQAPPPAATLPSYDFTYNRTPRRYMVPEEDRRPYGEPTGEIRGPGYFYSIGSFAASLFGIALTGFIGFQVLIMSYIHDEYGSLGYMDYEFTSITNNMLIALVPVAISLWLGIFTFIVNKGCVTPMTGRMRAFATLGIILGGLGLLGIIGNFFLYLLFLP